MVNFDVSVHNFDHVFNLLDAFGYISSLDDSECTCDLHCRDDEPSRDDTQEGAAHRLADKLHDPLSAQPARVHIDLQDHPSGPRAVQLREAPNVSISHSYPQSRSVDPKGMLSPADHVETEPSDWQSAKSRYADRTPFVAADLSADPASPTRVAAAAPSHGERIADTSNAT